MGPVSHCKEGCARQKETDETLRELGVLMGETLSGLRYCSDDLRARWIYRPIQHWCTA